MGLETCGGAAFGGALAGSDGRRHAALMTGIHGALSRTLGLDPATFVFLAGATGRGTMTAAGLTAIADMVVPPHAVAPAPRRGRPSFATAYRRFLEALAPEADAGLRALLGPLWGDWLRHRAAALPGSRQADLFADWSHRLPQPLAARARARFTAAADPLDRVRDLAHARCAQVALLCPDGTTWPAPAYDGIAAIAAGAIHLRAGGRLDFDSAASGPDAMSDAADLRRVMPAPRRPYLPEVADPELETRFAQARLTVRGAVGRVGLAPVGPAGWFDPATVEAARAAGDDGEASRVWDPASTAGRWTAFFGPRGALRARVTHLVVVSDVMLDITCHARFGPDDLAALNRGSPGGVWPFAAPVGAPIRRPSFALTPEGHLSVAWHVPRGAVQCWGGLVGMP